LKPPQLTNYHRHFERSHLGALCVSD